MKNIQLIKDSYEFSNTYHNHFEDLEIIESYVDYITVDCYVSGKLIISTHTLQECLDKLKAIGLNVVGFVSSNGYYSESVDVVKIPLEDLK